MSDDRMTKEEIVASCNAAGQAIDIESCEVRWGTCNDGYVLVGRVPFVRSAKSDGWVCLYWLPEDKALALHARIERGDGEPKDDWPF